MPAEFKDDAVHRFLERFGCDTEGTPADKRERAAVKSEQIGDHLQAWEIRNGCPWDEMTRKEAEVLVKKKTQMIRNFGVMSILCCGNYPMTERNRERFDCGGKFVSLDPPAETHPDDPEPRCQDCIEDLLDSIDPKPFTEQDVQRVMAKVRTMIAERNRDEMQ